MTLGDHSGERTIEITILIPEFPPYRPHVRILPIYGTAHANLHTRSTHGLCVCVFCHVL